MQTWAHYPYPDFDATLVLVQLPAMFFVLSFLTWLNASRINEA
jgi:hypothetical protein